MKHTLMITLAAALLGTACAPATQNIPVSSNPDGATVYADGTEACTTPCNVTLVRTQAHILTLKKDGYKQADVQIAQKYDTAAVTRGAVQSGTWTSSNGASTEGAVSNALLTAGNMEEQGTAYVLTPASVVVDLVPVAGAKHVAQSDGSQPVEISSDQLAPEDQAKLKGDQPVVISSDQLSEEDQARLKGKEKATMHTTEPATMSSAMEDNPEKEAEAVLEGAAAAAPTIKTGKGWESSHSSEHSDGPGSYTKTTTKTGAHVGVSVNPAEAGLEVLHMLEGADKDSDDASE